MFVTQSRETLRSGDEAIIHFGKHGAVSSTDNQTGESTTRVGIKAEVSTPKIVNTEFKAGINISVGQKEKE